MDDFPSNSNRERDERQSPPKAKTVPVKEVKRVTTGTPKRRKKPLSTRFKETFFGGGDARGVWGYVMGEVLVPAAKDMIADATTQAVEKAVFGETRRAGRYGGWRSGNSGSVGHTRYNAAYTPAGSAAPWRSGQQQRDVSARGRAMHDFDEILLDSRGEAEMTLDTLREIVQQYNVASVADLYALVGITSAYTDNKYGWNDLSQASVQSVRGGQYLLNLPKPEPLD